MLKMKTNVGLVIALMIWVAPSYAAELKGKVRWVEPVVLSTNLSTEVTKADAMPGQYVKRGAVLAKLRSDVVRAEVDHARTELEYRELALEEAQSELDRTQELYDRTLLADHDLNLARIAFSAAKSVEQQARVRLKAASYRLEKSRIVAPFNAVVLTSHISVGETLNGQFKAAPIYTVTMADARRVTVAGSVQQATTVSLGDELKLLVVGKNYLGKVTAIHLSEDSSEDALIDVQFKVDAKSAPQIGQTVTVNLP